PGPSVRVTSRRMNSKPGTLSDGWVRDLTRASITTILYVGAIYAGLKNSFLYGGGLGGYFPFLLSLFVGPLAPAWLACKIVAINRPLLLRLALGTYAAFVPFLFVLYAVSALTPEWKLGDPPSRLNENKEAFLVVALFVLSLLATTTVFSRWKAGTPTSG